MGKKKYVLQPGQTTLSFVVLPQAQPQVIPLDPNTCYSPQVITPKWSPPSSNPTLDAVIPSTRNWTKKEMQFFKFSYYQTKYFEVSEYFCPDGPQTQAAKDIIASGMSLGRFTWKEHTNQGGFTPLALFGEAILRTHLPPQCEANADALAAVLLQIANCDFKMLMSFPQRGQFVVQFGKQFFVSITDASLVGCVNGQLREGPTFIVIEDKQLGVDDGEYQIPGEMLATAYRNYFDLHISVAQTIYAMRIIGANVTFYRADFPASFLESVKAGTRPQEHITIFRVGGDRAKETKRIGLALTDHSEQRVKALSILCSIVYTCFHSIQPFWQAFPVKEPPMTTQRVVQLQSTYAL